MDQLISLAAKHQNDWNEVALVLTLRNADSCRKKWSVMTGKKGSSAVKYSSKFGKFPSSSSSSSSSSSLSSTSMAAEENYEWEETGSDYIGKRVARSFFDDAKQLRFTHGSITKWLPPDDEDEALFHMVHEDGDEEDLNEVELLSAIDLYKMTSLHIGDQVIVNWRGKGKWWHGRIADVRQETKKGRHVSMYDVRYDDGDSEKNVLQKNIYKRFEDDPKKTAAITPDPKEGGTGSHVIPVSGIRASPRNAEENKKPLLSFDKSNPHKHTLKFVLRPGYICDLCETQYGASHVWQQ